MFLLIAAFLVTLNFCATRLFANCADAETDLLLFMVHLDNLELMFGVDFKLYRNVILVNCLGDVA